MVRVFHALIACGLLAACDTADTDPAEADEGRSIQEQLDSLLSARFVAAFVPAREGVIADQDPWMAGKTFGMHFDPEEAFSMEDEAFRNALVNSKIEDWSLGMNAPWTPGEPKVWLALDASGSPFLALHFWPEQPDLVIFKQVIAFDEGVATLGRTQHHYFRCEVVSKDLVAALMQFEKERSAVPFIPSIDLEGMKPARNGKVRWVVREDGRRDVYLLSDDGFLITRRSLAETGRTLYVTLYRMDKDGRPLSCKGYDKDKKEVFKVSFGYRKKDMKLVEMRVFDSATYVDSSSKPIFRNLFTGDDEQPVWVLTDGDMKEEDRPEWASIALERFDNPFLKEGMKEMGELDVLEEK